MLTELDIVNDMLAATGTAPVTASDTQHPSYVKASNKLQRVSNAAQNLGLWFNTTYPTLPINTDNEIVLPANTLDADPVSRKSNYVKRGARLYNLDTRSFTITEAVKVKLITKLSLEEMPEAALNYIRDKARFEFYLDEDGTEPKLSNYRAASQIAWTVLYREHLRNRDVNYFDGPNAANDLARGRSRLRLPGPQE